MKKFLQLEIGWLNYHIPLWSFLVAIVAVVAVFSGAISMSFLSGPKIISPERGRLVTIYDQGDEKTILTKAETVAKALVEAGIATDGSDVVEPAPETAMVASSYSVNIYRARPVVVRDGVREVRVVTAAQTGRTIAKAAEISLAYEDLVNLQPNDDVLNGDGAIIVAEIERALPVDLVLYGQKLSLKTQAKTVAEFIVEKDLRVSDSDSVLPGREAEIAAGMEIKIWREGVNTISTEEEIPFKTEQVYDSDQFIGFREVRTNGKNGRRSITWEIEMHGGKETSRREIQNVIIDEPVNKVEVVGTKSRASTTSAGENEEITWNYLRNQGFSRIQTAGIMGNLMQEHGFQTSGDGLAQWTGGRKATLMAMADPYSIYTQLDFLMYELNGGYRRVKDNLLGAQTVEDATIIFQDQFERCGVCMQQRRIEFAYSIFGRY